MSMFLVDRFGRKGLLLTSTFVCSLSVLTLGAYFYLEENKCLENGPEAYCKDGFRMEIVDSLNWMPIVSNECLQCEWYKSKLMLAGVNCAVHLLPQYWYWTSTMDYDWRAFP